MQYSIYAIFFSALIFSACVNSDAEQPISTEDISTTEIPVKTEIPEPVLVPVDTVSKTIPEPETPVTVDAKIATPPPTPPKPSTQINNNPPPKPQPVVNNTPPPAPSQKPIVKLLNPRYDYGYIGQGEVVKHIFTIKNVGNAPLNILRASASCGCTRPEYSFMPIMPGETSDVKVHFNSTGKLGRVESKVTILTDALPETHYLYLDGTVTDKKVEKPVENKPAPKTDVQDKKEGNKKIETQEEKVPEKENMEDKKPGKEFKPRPILPGRKLPKGNIETEQDSSDVGGK